MPIPVIVSFALEAGRALDKAGYPQFHCSRTIQLPRPVFEVFAKEYAVLQPNHLAQPVHEFMIAGVRFVANDQGGIP